MELQRRNVRFLRLSTSFAYYGLAMDLQKFGVDIYLIQVIFGAVDIPAKVLITVSMSFIGRRPSQCGALIVAGVTILINLLVPYGTSEHVCARVNVTQQKQNSDLIACSTSRV